MGGGLMGSASRRQDLPAARGGALAWMPAQKQSKPSPQPKTPLARPSRARAAPGTGSTAYPLLAGVFPRPHLGGRAHCNRRAARGVARGVHTRWVNPASTIGSPVVSTT